MGYEIDFLAVGEGSRSGDAIAVRFGNLYGARQEQKVVVVDGGFKESGTKVVEHVQNHFGTDVVDLVVSTHPDDDHSAGLALVLKELRVGQLWMHLPWLHTQDIARMFVDGRVTDASIREHLRKSLDTARDLESLATRRGIPIVEPFAGLSEWNGAVRVLGPGRAFYESLLPHFRGTPAAKDASMLEHFARGATELIKRIAESWDIETLTDDGETAAENNSSAVLLFAVDGKGLLLTGDAGVPALTAAADELDQLGFSSEAIEFIQVPHHGSRRNVGPTILNRLLGTRRQGDEVRKIAFVSCAKEGEPKHPSKKVMNAFRRRGAPVHATQGSDKWQHSDAPPRSRYSPSVPLPFYGEVED